MNIMFADLQSSTVNLSESAVENGFDDGRFADLMDQQLTSEEDLSIAAEYSQVSENIDISLIPEAGLTQQMAITSGSETPPAWLEYLASQQSDVVLEETPEAISPTVTDLETTNQSATTPMLALPALNPTIGEQLPASGQSLPPGLVAAAVVPKETIRQANSVEAPLIDSIEGKSAKVADLADSELLNDTSSKLLRPDAGTDAKFQLKAGEFQSVNQVVADTSEIAGQNMRPSNVAMVNSPAQTANALLPTQLETLSVANTRDPGAWSQGIGERVHYMINQKLNTATIRLDPPSLGRLEIHIQVNDDITNVTINTQHAQTRELIDNASFRLRDYLQDNGYQNVNVDVSQQEAGQQQATEQSDDSVGNAGEDLSLTSVGEGNVEQTANQYFSSDSLVDYFA